MKNKRYKDTDLREALRRKYADTPQLPADFMKNMEQKTNPPMTRPVRRWWWVAAAASVLLIIGIGVTMMPTGETMPTASNVVAKVESPQASVVEATSKEPKKEGTSSQKTVNKKTDKKQPAKKQKKQLHDSGKQQKTVPVSPTVSPAYTDHLHYASAELTKDTLPYQNPARVDEFIAKMAAYNHVKQGELECTQPAGSNVVSSVYVFPDNKGLSAEFLASAVLLRTEGHASATAIPLDCRTCERQDTTLRYSCAFRHQGIVCLLSRLS